MSGAGASTSARCRLQGIEVPWEMRVFKDELRQAITHPGQVPHDELSSHVQYEDGSPEKLLRRLWRDLYGDEPVPGPGRG